MRSRLCAFCLAGFSLAWPVAERVGAEPAAQPQCPVPMAEISSEDRQVVQNMELLAMMDLLKDMKLLEGEPKAETEEKK